DGLREHVPGPRGTSSEGNRRSRDRNNPLHGRRTGPRGRRGTLLRHPVDALAAAGIKRKGGAARPPYSSPAGGSGGFGGLSCPILRFRFASRTNTRAMSPTRTSASPRPKLPPSAVTAGFLPATR